MNQNLDRNRPPVLNMTVGSRKSGKCNSMASREDASASVALQVSSHHAEPQSHIPNPHGDPELQGPAQGPYGAGVLLYVNPLNQGEFRWADGVSGIELSHSSGSAEPSFRNLVGGYLEPVGSVRRTPNGGLAHHGVNPMPSFAQNHGTRSAAQELQLRQHLAYQELQPYHHNQLQPQYASQPPQPEVHHQTQSMHHRERSPRHAYSQYHQHQQRPHREHQHPYELQHHRHDHQHQHEQNGHHQHAHHGHQHQHEHHGHQHQHDPQHEHQHVQQYSLQHPHHHHQRRQSRTHTPASSATSHHSTVRTPTSSVATAPTTAVAGPHSNTASPWASVHLGIAAAGAMNHDAGYAGYWMYDEGDDGDEDDDEEEEVDELADLDVYSHRGYGH